MKLVLVMVQNGAAKVHGLYQDLDEMVAAAERLFGPLIASELRGASEGKQIRHSTGAYVVNWQAIVIADDFKAFNEVVESCKNLPKENARQVLQSAMVQLGLG